MKRSRANTLDQAFIFANAIAVWLVYSHGAGVEGRQFTLVNKCSHVVCPGIQPAAGQVVIARGGLCLAPETAKTIEAPAGWSGRIWGRHGCTFDEGGNHGFCSTGDCGGVLFCNGASFSPPATIVDITFSASSSAPDFYDVSLVDGYNLPVIICPSEGGSGQCPVVGCPNDINVVCPHFLQVVEKESVVACKSACMAFDSPEYCCKDRYGEPTTCKPSLYSKLFKSKCPLAYSYSHDDARPVACSGGLHYDVTFCPGV